MTSSRGQNVSVFQQAGSERWKPPVTVFSNTGGSISRNSLASGKSISIIEKNSGQQFCKRSSDYIKAYSNKDLTTNPVKFSNLGSANRELSPVRWCDRNVDGVYLGRSGWVHVQQRSLDDSKEVVYCNNSFYTLPCRKHFSEIDSNFTEEREHNRPLNLPLSSKKYIVRENCERPSKFFQEFESISPPSVTPIISPPPAFKDDGVNVEFPRQSIRKPFCSEELIQLGSKSSCCPPKEKRNTLKPLSHGLSTGPSLSTVKHLPHQTLQMKSLNNNFSNRICQDRCFNTAAFHSLDTNMRTGENGPIKVCDSDTSKNFEEPEEKINSDECDNEDIEDSDNKMTTSKGYLLGFMSSSKEELRMRNPLKVCRQRNYQRNGRRTSSTHRTRSSSSSDSSSSTSNKNSEKIVSSRRTNSKEKQTLEFENSSGRNGKQFHVKRSRSLQLSEKRSPSESILNNSSGKSWDPMPPEYSMFQSRETALQFPQHLHHVLVTVNGDSIPVGSSDSQSLKSLNKITTSEEQQKKLIMEAEKEARIISEFLNGTRSRAAARNLLMHRYVNRHEDMCSIELSENSPPKDVYESHVLESHGRENLWKKNKPTSSGIILQQLPTTLYSKPFTSLFRASSTSNPTGSLISLQNLSDQRKKEGVESKGCRSSYSSSSEQCSKSRRPKNKSENTNHFLNQTYQNSVIEKPSLHLFDEKQKAVLGSDPEVLNIMLKNAPHILPDKKVNGNCRDYVQNSSISPPPSPPPDFYRVDFGARIIKKTKGIPDTCSPTEDFISEEEKKIPLAFRPDSAPGSDDSIDAAVDQRSLSLPRSFLSERYRLNYSNQRDLLQWKHQDEEIFYESTNELPLNSQRSRTAPTTPTRDLRYGKGAESLNQIQCTGSSHTTHLDESSSSNSRRVVQTFIQGKPEHSDVNLSEGCILIYKNPPKLSDTVSETVFKKFKKNFPLKYLKNRGKSKECKELNHHNNEHEDVEDSYESISTACRVLSGLPSLGNDDQVSEKYLRFTKEQNGSKRVLKSEKYDSHDSGIQMGNRGNIDSSESQDTDLQEDMDSPLVRKHWIRGSCNSSKKESEIFNQALTDPLKVDIQWQSKKLDYGKGVRRTNSDVGSQKLFYSDFRSPWGSLLLGSYPSPIRDQNAKTLCGLPSPESTIVRNKFTGTKLRRSLSQPLGLNELPPFSSSSRLKCFALSEDEKNPRAKNSEDECLSDSESSTASLQERKKSFDFASRDESTMLAEAVWDHVAIESCELPFKAGDVIEVLDTQNWDWWWGATAENKGYFPSAFVRLRVNQEDTVEDCLAAIAKGKYNSNRLRRGKSVSLLSNDQVRSSVVKELLNTEQDFVKILRDLKEGYIEQCKRRTDMFTPTQITTIFSNLEDLLVFQERFLKDLESNVDSAFPHKSCIGKVFLTHGGGFRTYSEYCNSHPMAIATLQDLYQRNGYCKFFETCRLKQSLIEIPLDGYLLTPVQRICKYPLQLAELLKYTKPEHPDYKEVEEALETMRGVATLINERKRKMESLEKLAAWQQRVEGWEGEDLIEISSRLIHQGDVVRITSGVWTSNITLFLFDHQIVYCKKDLLKRNVYIYKGRIFLDACAVVDVPDGKNQQLGVTIKYGLKICSSLKDKWLLFCCRTSEDKAKWLEALEEEKRLVAQDRQVDLDLPPTAKQLAKMAARTKKCPPYKLSGKNKFLSNHEEMPFRNCSPGTSKTKTSRRVGTWFTLGGVIKNSKTNLRQRTSFHRVT